MASFTKPGLSHHTTLGGTGISIDRTDQGSLLIGDGTGFKLNTLIGGTGISIVNGDGTITISGTTAYSLPIASASVLGGIKVGANLSIDGSGILSGASPYVLPVASVSVLGGVKQGSNVTIDGSGVISVAGPYTLPIASSIILGGVKVGSGLSIDGGGTLSTTGVPAGVSVGAAVWNSTSQAITNSLATIISWDTVDWDTDSIHPAVSSRLTCHTAGYYLVWVSISWDAPTDDSQIMFRVNGTQFYEGTTTAIDAHSDLITTSTVLYLSPGDFVECRVFWQGPGGPINVSSTLNPRSPRFGLQMLTAGTSGGIAGGETIKHSGVTVATRPNLNLIDGTNVILTVADNGGTNSVDVTVASTGVVETVKHVGTTVGTRPNINFIDGSNVTLTIADNPGTSSVDVTVASTAGGGNALAPAVRVYTLADELIASNVSTALVFEHTSYDQGTATPQHSDVTNNTRLTCRVAGVYSIFGRVEWQGWTTDGDLISAIVVNGIKIITSTSMMTRSSGGFGYSRSQTLSHQYFLNVGDYVELVVLTEILAGQHIFSSGNDTSPSFGMTLVGEVTGTGGGAISVASAISFVMNGGGSAVVTGNAGTLVVPYNCVITSCTVLADLSSSTVLGIKKTDYATYPSATSITASAPPTLSAAVKSQDSTLTGWTTSLNAGDILEYTVTSNTAATELSLILLVNRT